MPMLDLVPGLPCLLFGLVSGSLTFMPGPRACCLPSIGAVLEQNPRDLGRALPQPLTLKGKV